MNTFTMNGKTYHHPKFTRAQEIDRYVLVSNAPAKLTDAEVESLAVGSGKMQVDFVGHLNYDSATKKWSDNTGELDVVFPEGSTPFSFKTFSNFTEFENECK